MQAWLDSGALRADPTSDRAPFVIAIPPPNVTGALHMGHALNDTMQDVLIRRARMAGREAMWICGTDHAGIATQAQVEKQLAREGTSRKEIGREAFEKRVWQWREEHGGVILEQMKRLGCTLDYSRERFTMDEGYARAVTKVFVDLYNKGYIYRDRYLVNWDPGLGSAISDLEVEDREVEDTLVSIAYPLADGDGEVVVATVRPETMLGDVAVAVNPHDERYTHLIGREVILPLVGRRIPVIADDDVEPGFGTGALKVTPAHDPVDFEIGRRHGLDQVSVIGEDGRMTDAAPEPYRGLTTAECAARVVADLKAQGLVRKEEPYTHTVPFSHRSGARVEPLISLQWFCDMSRLAPPAIEVVADGRVRFTPERWAGVYLRWMEEIRPWCISRQLWWGHQIPVWYRGEEIHVGEEAPEGEGWVRDPDVLDTWFSSALWPFATLGWPDETPELARFYPTDVLCTARDIIFLWVARMVMMGLEYMGEVPFRDVCIHSVIQAPDGRRMSKSLGTGIDPIEVIEVHGADALRFGLMLMSSAQDVRYNNARIEQGRQLVTKLWNATRLVVDRGGRAGALAPEPRLLADRWMASRITAAIAEADARIAEFDLAGFADGIYHLIFDDFCDWYLEWLKAGEASPEMAGVFLEELLALAHPLIPFVTEECWSRMPGSSGLMLVHRPATPPGPADPAAEEEIDRVRAEVGALRGFRSSRDLPKRTVIVTDPAPHPLTAAVERVEACTDPSLLVSRVLVPWGGIAVGVADGGVDLEAERARIDAEIAKAESELARAQRQLANERFVQRAPAHLVEAERGKVARYSGELEELRRQREALG